jgi:hypothetical protein
MTPQIISWTHFRSVDPSGCSLSGVVVTDGEARLTAVFIGEDSQGVKIREQLTISWPVSDPSKAVYEYEVKELHGERKEHHSGRRVLAGRAVPGAHDSAGDSTWVSAWSEDLGEGADQPGRQDTSSEASGDKPS